METNRRSFLLGLLAAGTAATVKLPAYAAVAAPVTKPMGFSVPIHGRAVNDARDLVAIIDKALVNSARNHLPPGTRYEIRLGTLTDYGRTRGVAWYHHPDMANDPDWGHEERSLAGRWVSREGEPLPYGLIEQRVTPLLSRAEEARELTRQDAERSAAP